MHQRFARSLALLAGLLLSARCAVEAPVTTRVHLRFDGDARRVEITTTTDLKRDWEVSGAKARLASTREAFLGGRDEWSNRYALLEPERERAAHEKEQGQLRRVERVAITDHDQLSRFFSDTPLTLQIHTGDVATELSIYTGNGSRATREQKDQVERLLTAWSEDGARYVAAVDRLYAYLERRPDRAEAVFTILLHDDEHPSAGDEEKALVEAARESIKQIAERAEAATERSSTIDEDFDDVFNPFPAAITVKTPSPIVAAENFKRVSDDSVEIPRAGITDAVRSLEGRWVSPDPLAILVRSLLGSGDIPAPETLAVIQRKRTAAVTPADVRTAIVQALRRAEVYRVRWR